MAAPDAPTAVVDSPQDAGASDTPSAESSKASGNWLTTSINRMLGRGEPESQEPADGKQEESKADPTAITLTQEEMDRRVQAETDRREAKRKAEDDAKARKELRRVDPIAHAELEEQEEAQHEATEQLRGVFTKTVSIYDEHTLSPLLATLPEAERQRLIDAAPAGMEGRKQLVTATIAAIEKQAVEKAKADLRRNPAFRKEMNAEIRGESQEPEAVTATGGTGPSRDMNTFMRQVRVNGPRPRGTR